MLCWQVMLGGAWFTQSFGDPETVLPATLLHQAQDAVRTQLGVLATPSHSIVMVHKVGVSGQGQGRAPLAGPAFSSGLLYPQACLPQYTLGHCQRIGKAELCCSSCSMLSPGQGWSAEARLGGGKGVGTCTPAAKPSAHGCAPTEARQGAGTVSCQVLRPSYLLAETITQYLQQEGLPLSLVGASYEGVSVIDCLYSAKMAVARLLGQAC